MTVMNEGGVAFVGIGEANSEEDDRVKAAVNEALHSPLLGEISLKQAQGALIRVVGGPDMTVSEAQRASEIVMNSIADRARIIWGCSIDPEIEGTIKILIILTGAQSKYVLGKDAMSSPQKLGSSYGQPAPQRVGGSPSPAPRGRQDDDGIDFVR
jgi:cell division protein FtsZ